MLRDGEAKLSGYCPKDNPQEGGFRDCQGRPLQPLQTWLAGKRGKVLVGADSEGNLVDLDWIEEDGAADYVTVAMDNKAVPLGTEICIPAINRFYGRQIPFRVLDNGSHFNDKTGWEAIDICCHPGTNPDTGRPYMEDEAVNVKVAYVAGLKTRPAWV